MIRKKWLIPQLNKSLASTISDECGIDPFLALIMTSRGMTDPFDIEEFLSDDLEIGDPFELKDMQKAVDRTRLAIDNFEKIAVFGDYDCDGVTSTALVYGYLSGQGADVIFHIPSRDDGYGMTVEAVDRLKAEGVTLIVTVDNGISALAEIDYAKTLGIDVVVTDHHLPGERLPAAVAVVDPHRADCASEFKDLAGVGVAFKFICALAGCFPEEMLGEYADLTALGTVADVMPLVGENRAIVKAGLKSIVNNKRPGIISLLKAAASDGKPVTATTLAFVLAPRINAAGRMGNSERAVRLLLESDPAVVGQITDEICSENVLRQKTEQEIADAAVRMVAENNMEFDRVIVVAGENWHHGVVGIAASRLVERYGRPVIILSSDGATASGSGRSIAGFNLFEAVRSAENLLIKYGGHTLAAGMTLETANIDAFRKAVNDYAAENNPVMPIPELKLDCKLNAAAVSLDLCRAIASLAPFGSGNPVPRFAICGLKIENIQGIGGDKHIKLFLSRDGAMICGVYFGVSPDSFAYEKGDVIDIAVQLEVNVWQGEENLSIQIKDIRPNGFEDSFFSDVWNYENFCRGEHADLSILNPTREDAAVVFRIVRNAGKIGFDKLLTKLYGKMTYGKAVVAVDVLSELGVLTREGDIVAAVPGVKADFASSEILERINKMI